LKLNLFEEFPAAWKEFENLFERNRIFIDRTVNVYNCSKQWLRTYRFTCCGVDYDVCVAQPFIKILILLFQENQVILRSFCVRNEVWESLSIIRQALKNARRK
jgi:NADH-quinone oxidoreductase subunit D